MDFEKFTDKTRRFVQQAQTLALRHKHQKLTADHLLKAFLDDTDGHVKKLIKNAGGDFTSLKKSVEGNLANEGSSKKSSQLIKFSKLLWKKWIIYTSDKI